MKSGKVVLGILAGIAAGAALGILFAPDKGSETRRKISEKSDAYAEALGASFNKIIEGLAQQIDTLREDAEQKVEHADHTTAKDLEAELIADTKRAS